MKTHIENVSPVQRKLTVDVAVEQVAAALEKAYAKVQKTATMKGFRQGKVPRNLLAKYFRRETETAAIEHLVESTYSEASKQSNVTPISRPQFETGAFAAGQPFSYSATFEIRPEVQLTTYSGFTLQRAEFTITDAEVEEQLRHAQQAMTRLTPVDETTGFAEGMVARIDFEGTADGKSFDGGKATDYIVDLDQGNVLPAFAEQIRGMRNGEQRAIQFAYPADYFNVSIAGSTAHFQVTCKELKRKVVPALDDELAKELGNFQTLADVRADIRRRLETMKDRQVKGALAEQAMRQLLERHPFDVPQTMVGWELQSMWQDLERRAKAQQKTMADLGMTPEPFVKEYETAARDRVRGYLLLDAIADAEQMTATDDEIDARLEEIAQATSQPTPKVRLYYEQNNLLATLRRERIHEKALDFIIRQSKIEIEKVKTEEKKAK